MLVTLNILKKQLVRSGLVCCWFFLGRLFTKLNDDYVWSVCLLVLPLFYFLFIVLPDPIGMGMHFGNDFPEHRIWWTQTNLFYISNGMVPLWNPLDEFGRIHFGIRGGGFLYPFSWWLYAPFSLGGKWNYLVEYIQISLHMSISLFGIFQILRKFIKVSLPIAVVAASVFLFNHRFVDSIRYPNAIETIAWVPWIVFFSLKLVTKTGNLDEKYTYLTDWLLLTLCTLLCWLAGYGHLTYISLLFTGILLLINAKKLSAFFLPFSAIVGGSLLSVGILLPIALSITGSATRGGGNMSFADSNSLESYFDMFLQPFAVDVHASAFFIPVFALFGIGGVIFAFKKSYNKNLSTSMFIGMVILGDLSLGRGGFLFEFFYNNIPFYNAFRIQGRNNWITLIPVCYFCAIGMDVFVKGSKPVKVLWSVLILLVMIYATYFLHGIGKVGPEFSANTMRWITVKEGARAYIYLSMAMSIFLLLFLLVKQYMVRVVCLLLICYLFAVNYGKFTTWYNEEVQPDAVMDVSEYYPDGILASFEKGSSMRLLSPVLVSNYEKVEKFDTYKRVISGAQSSVATRFAFSTKGESDTRINVSLKMLHFNANKLSFTVDTPVEGDLIYFSSYSKFWKSNVPFRKGVGDFSPFTVFHLSSGVTDINFEFRPLILVLSSLISLIAIFGLSAILLWNDQKKWSAICVVMWGIVGCCIFVIGIYSPVSFSDTYLYGEGNPIGGAYINVIREKI